jgi:tryptophanyl-tRNA synthetase
VRIFSGIQPTGRKHLGNHISAVSQYVAGQDRGEAIYCIVDLLATTTYQPASPGQLRETVHDVAAVLMAAGVDPARCVLFRQSDVPEHAELSVILATVTAVADLNGMHRSRGKSTEQRDSATLGQFFYPMIVAADALTYRADEVLGGDDQRFHVDLMRTVVGRFNSRYGDTLVAPEVRLPSVGAQIMDLQHPDRKMSTTGDSELGTVHILDEPAAIREKLRSAVVGSDDEVVRGEDRAGVSNLIEIMAAVRGTDPEQVEREFKGQSVGEFKEAVAQAVVGHLAPVRERYRAIRADDQRIEAVLVAGAERARAIAGRTLAGVREAMGLSSVRSR